LVCGEMTMSESALDWAKVGERLRRIRKESGLSQRDFGRKCGVSQNMISLYEKGRSRAPVDFYVQVAHLGGKTIEWLLTGHEDHTLETLREVRDLQAKIAAHLAVVRQLLDRETDEVWVRTLSAVQDPVYLRELLLREKELPASLRELLDDSEAWIALAMTGREICLLRTLTEAFGDIGRGGIRLYLQIVRHAPREGGVGRPLLSGARAPLLHPPDAGRAIPADPT